jgi:very-short-patch-repair endonuclease
MPQKHLTALSRNLRRNATDAEIRLWGHLRNRQLLGFKFRRQMPIGSQYVADFECDQAKLLVELDGGRHAGSRSDAERTAVLESWGYRVLRFWNNDVLENTDGVLDEIARAPRTASNV